MNFRPFSVAREWQHRHARSLSLAQALLIAAALITATIVLGRVLHAAYPIQDWLFWHIASIWGWELFLTAACLSLGYSVLHRGLKLDHLPACETLVLSMALGLVGFVLALYCGGALGWFRPWFAVALPLVLIGAGAPSTVPRLRRAWHQIKLTSHLPWLSALCVAYGLLCLAVIYLQVLTPDSLGCDAKWFHVTAAQDFAREGRIVSFQADWAKALPQLTSVLHTWAFLVPGLRLPVRWIMVLHTEFVLFLWTLGGVVAAVRYLARTEGATAAWAAFFLFPSIFIYDSNLSGAADHITAFFCLPMLIAGLRTTESPSLGTAVAAGAMAGGALLTKYQGIYVVLPIAALVVIRGCVALVRRSGRANGDARRYAVCCAGFAATSLVVVSPYLIKNQAFHHNPLYPFLMESIRASTPVIPGGARMFNDHLAHVNTGPLWPRLRDALGLVFTFAFDFRADHLTSRGPFLGPLFSLLLPLILLVRDRRMWGAALVGVCAIVGWAIGFPTPRNIETFLPVLVAFAAAMMAIVWKKGWVARAALLPLIGLQLVWGGDHLFLSGHGRIASAMDIVRAGAEGRTKDRLSRYRADYIELGRALPKDSVLLLHTWYEQLGINRRILLDWPGFQGLIDYRPMRSARDVYDRYREVGITHIAVDPSWPAHSRQEEVLFDMFLVRYAKDQGRVGPFQIWQMPASAPPQEPPYRVLCLGISRYPDGVYTVDELDNLDEDPPLSHAPDVRWSDDTSVPLLKSADAVVVAAGAKDSIAKIAEVSSAFHRPVTYAAYSVYLRRAGR